MKKTVVAVGVALLSGSVMASGAFDGETVANSNAGLSRAEVRAQAIANPPASGVFDGSTVAQQHRVAPTQAAGE